MVVRLPGSVLAEQMRSRDAPVNVEQPRMRPGVKLSKEAELQQMFNVSRGAVREALKALEVQGLVSLSTGPDGGAT